MFRYIVNIMNLYNQNGLQLSTKTQGKYGIGGRFSRVKLSTVVLPSLTVEGHTPKCHKPTQLLQKLKQGRVLQYKFASCARAHTQLGRHKPTSPSTSMDHLPLGAGGHGPLPQLFLSLLALEWLGPLLPVTVASSVVDVVAAARPVTTRVGLAAAAGETAPKSTRMTARRASAATTRLRMMIDLGHDVCQVSTSNFQTRTCQVDRRLCFGTWPGDEKCSSLQTPVDEAVYSADQCVYGGRIYST